jgi:hypothetical protein
METRDTLYSLSSSSTINTVLIASRLLSPRLFKYKRLQTIHRFAGVN